MVSELDPTELWIRGISSSELGLGEQVLSPFLLAAAIFAQLLASMVYNYRDTQPVQYKGTAIYLPVSCQLLFSRTASWRKINLSPGNLEK